MSRVLDKIAILLLASLVLVACRPSPSCCCREGGEKAVAAKRERISPEQQFKTAYHEAAHCVFDMALLPKRGVSKLEVFSKVNEDRLPGLRLLGLMTAGDGPMECDPAYQHRALALISLAGGAAEDVLLRVTPPDNDPDSDNSAFESLAYCEAAHCECPPASRVGDECLMNGLLKPERERLYAEAKACVEANKVVIIRLAKLVMLKEEDTEHFVRTLSQQELMDFFEANPLDVEACLSPESPSSSPALFSTPDPPLSSPVAPPFLSW